MPSDYGHEYADKELKSLEKRITKEYKQAAKEVEKKMNDYLAKFADKDAQMKKRLGAGEITASEYAEWRMRQMFTGDRWKAMSETLSADLVNVDKIAAGMINDSMPSSYAENFNYGTYEVEHGAKMNTNFVLYDKDTVINLMKDGPKIIPKANVDIPKDMVWNKRKIISAVTQGILQGEAIPKIARRLQSVTDMDRRAAIRNARTYTTAAENKGRIDSYDRAKDMGINVKKEWLATLDDLTRVEHRHLDGMAVDNDEPFETDGYKIMYPGDPDAEPEMIYNCRCTIVARIVDYKYNDERNDSKLEGMSYEEWKHARDRQIKPEEIPKKEPKADHKLPPKIPKIGVGSELKYGSYGRGKIEEYDQDYDSFFVKFEGREEPVELSYEKAWDYYQITAKNALLSEEQRDNIEKTLEGKNEEDRKFFMPYLQDQEFMGYSQQDLKDIYEETKDLRGREKTEKISEKFSLDIANENNFFMNSTGTWKPAEDRETEPDHISYNKRTGGVSSEYWYTKEGVYRRSDHWGGGVASCSWYIDGREYSPAKQVEIGERETAFIPWEELRPKAHVEQMDGIYYLAGYRFKN